MSGLIFQFLDPAVQNLRSRDGELLDTIDQVRSRDIIIGPSTFTTRASTDSILKKAQQRVLRISKNSYRAQAHG